MSNWKLTTPEALGRLLADLTGASIQVKIAKPLAPLPAAGVLVATYADAAGKVGTAAIFDVGAAASVAAALTVIVPAQARASIDAKKLSPSLLENLREICNVMVGAYSPLAPGATQLSLRDVFDKPAALPPEVAELVKKPAARLDTTISVRGYMSGYVALLSS
jgi:hypothetical protein